MFKTSCQTDRRTQHAKQNRSTFKYKLKLGIDRQTNEPLISVRDPN